MADWLQKVLARAHIIAMPKLGPELAAQRWPQVSGTIETDGLNAPVEILRDRWGVPHIYAETEHDLFFAQGYAHAQDRLWQMEMNRRIADGTLSEVMGQAGLQSDIFMRTLGLRRIAERMWAQVHGETRLVAQAYVDGVNAHIAQGKSLPLEFTLLGIPPAPWSAIDLLNRGNLLSLALGGNYRIELLRARLIAEVGEALTTELFPPHAPETPLIITPRAEQEAGLKGISELEGLEGVDRWLGDPNIVSGSNNWVVHGSRTASGQPLLANDIHIGLGVPSTWYANGLHGGRFDGIGFSLPGVPLLVLGHNGRIAWGMSNLGPDTQDFYIEKLDHPEDPRHYQYAGRWHPLDVLVESIPVRGEASMELVVRSTRHGPIMNAAMGQLLRNAEPLALRWALTESAPLLGALVDLNLAGDFGGFRAAVARWESPGQNFVYADAQGNIGYQATGKIPIRAAGHDGLAPVPGWTGDYEWQGFIPFTALPAALNPEPGFVATANNKVTPDDYPYSIARHYFPGYRAKRIVELLQSNARHRMDDMRRIQADTYSLPAEALRPYLLQAIPTNDREARALAAVRAWDLRYEIDRIGATVFQAFYLTLLRRLLGHKLGAELTDRYLASEYERHGSMHMPMVIAAMADPQSHWFVDTKTARRTTRDQLVQECYVAAVQWLGCQYGTQVESWQWGRVHTVTLPHAPFGHSWPDWLRRIFNTTPMAARGDNYTVDGASFLWKTPFAVVHGTALRMIIDFADLEASIAMHTPGQSEHLYHPHRDDLLKPCLDGKYHPLCFGRAAVSEQCVSTLVLRPAHRGDSEHLSNATAEPHHCGEVL